MLVRIYKGAIKAQKNSKAKKSKQINQVQKDNKEENLVQVDSKTGKLIIKPKTEQRVSGYHREFTDVEDVHAQNVVEKNKL